MKRALTLIGCVAGAVIASKVIIENVLGIGITPALQAWQG